MRDGRGAVRRCVNVEPLDALMPALQLVQLGLLLVEFGERELLDLKLVVDLGEELRTLTRQLAVLGIARLVPRLQQTMSSPAISGSLRSAVTWPPTSASTSRSRSTSAVNVSLSGTATTDCCTCNAPVRRTSRHTATRARESLDGNR